MSLRSPLLFFLFIACNGNSDEILKLSNSTEPFNQFDEIQDIPVPKNYERTELAPGSFGGWLRQIRLKKDNRVYLYNGTLKKNQAAQFAVLDISVGKKDLQQCADAVMRLRAEFLYSQQNYAAIEFKDNNGKSYAWKGDDDRKRFDRFLELVFAMCGTASLEKQLKPVTELQEIQPGDVFIKGGFPGHAMLVVDMAVNKDGKKIVMLAQSYMPAQDIHIVKNPVSEKLTPWYEIKACALIETPEWIFERTQLYTWQ